MVHKKNGTIWRKGCCWNSQKADIQFFRATSPLSRGRLRSKGHGKLSMHYCADLETIDIIFRIIVSVNHLCLYAAVAEMCEEYETLHNRTGQPVVGGQSSSSLVPSVIKTEVPLDCDDLAHKDLLLQQYGERIEKLNCLHREAGGHQLEPIPYWKYKKWRPASSSSSTWWQWRESWCSS